MSNTKSAGRPTTRKPTYAFLSSSLVRYLRIKVDRRRRTSRIEREMSSVMLKRQRSGGAGQGAPFVPSLHKNNFVKDDGPSVWLGRGGACGCGEPGQQRSEQVRWWQEHARFSTPARRAWSRVDAPFSHAKTTHAEKKQLADPRKNCRVFFQSLRAIHLHCVDWRTRNDESRIVIWELGECDSRKKWFAAPTTHMNLLGFRGGLV